MINPYQKAGSPPSRLKKAAYKYLPPPQLHILQQRLIWTYLETGRRLQTEQPRTEVVWGFCGLGSLTSAIDPQAPLSSPACSASLAS